MKKKSISALAAVLLLALVLGTVSAGATVPVQTFSSSYLSQYSAYATATGSGNVKIEFSVSAVQLADTVGATTIVVQRKSGNSWVTAQTFYYGSTSGMLLYDALFHCGDVTYSGTSGNEYRAVVTVYAKIGNGSDSKSVTTNSVVA